MAKEKGRTCWFGRVTLPLVCIRLGDFRNFALAPVVQRYHHVSMQDGPETKPLDRGLFGCLSRAVGLSAITPSPWAEADICGAGRSQQSIVWPHEAGTQSVPMLAAKQRPTARDRASQTPAATHEADGVFIPSRADAAYRFAP